MAWFLDSFAKLSCINYFLLIILKGEFFLFNLVSDRLEKFEYYIRLTRNWFVNRIIMSSFILARKCFTTLKPYLHTDFLRKCADIVRELDQSINKELTLRKKIVTDKD